MRWSEPVFVIGFLVTLLLSSPAMAATLTVRDVGKDFICNCGCNNLLPVCDMECGEQLRKVIATKIEQGWDKPKIVAYMIDNYGEKLLAAPTKKGFNLTAWLTPFAAILVAGGAIFAVVRRWASRQPAASDALGGEDLARLEERYQRRMEAELKDFD
ncbi:MAG: cytochrome c-type biogenesis protein CcmH [Candidatus Tectomicrobia bacterium]|uniref:Cytochrome c-type biogenesis protein n=1 Tax=Tectimicrobiota bacterium TaxID=2528274 RepID=A0A932M2R0_UNCTE|nr:cytochrome c-type biogenesis protein CcmH [Candidatus Tectomicrobia bacterium]